MNYDENNIRYPEYPTFPLDAFPSVLRKAIEEVHRIDQAPIELIAMGALAELSIACQNRISVVRPGRDPSPVSLYLLNVTKSGDGKSVVDGNFLRHIKKFEKEKAEAIGSDVASHTRDLEFCETQKLGLNARIRKAAGDPTELAKLKGEWDHLENKIRLLKSWQRPQTEWIYSNGSLEGLRDALEGDRRSIGIVSYDAGGVLNGMLTTNMTELNDLWDGKDISIKLSSKQVHARDPRFSMFLSLQQSELELFLESRGKRGMGNGFLARFLFGKSTSTLVQHRTASKPDIDSLGEVIGKILRSDPDTQGKRLKLVLQGKEEEYWVSYFDTLRRLDQKIPWMVEMQPFVRKLPEQAARIAALFHYVDQQDTVFWTDSEYIGGQALRGAIRLCDWFMHSYKSYFTDDGSARREEIQRVADILAEKLVDSYQKANAIGRWVQKPTVNRDGRLSKVQAGGLFSWDHRNTVIAYTQQQIHNLLYKGDYDILGEALRVLEAQRKVYLAYGPKDGIVVLYSGRLQQISSGQGVLAELVHGA
jgi:hypothetical protein